MTSYARSVKSARDAWRESRPQRCMNCDRPGGWINLQVHEMERKSQAPNRWGVEENYLLLCQKCHDGPFATMPHSEQLSVKLMNDPDHFDLEAWLRIRDPELRAPERVTLSEIVEHILMEMV